jgi:hypothetical protein
MAVRIRIRGRRSERSFPRSSRSTRATPVVLRALVNAIGDGNNDPLWRSEVDHMDVQSDLVLKHDTPNDPRGRP